MSGSGDRLNPSASSIAVGGSPAVPLPQAVGQSSAGTSASLPLVSRSSGAPNLMNEKPIDGVAAPSPSLGPHALLGLLEAPEPQVAPSTSSSGLTCLGESPGRATMQSTPGRPHAAPPVPGAFGTSSAMDDGLVPRARVVVPILSDDRDTGGHSAPTGSTFAPRFPPRGSWVPGRYFTSGGIHCHRSFERAYKSPLAGPRKRLELKGMRLVRHARGSGPRGEAGPPKLPHIRWKTYLSLWAELDAAATAALRLWFGGCSTDPAGIEEGRWHRSAQGCHSVKLLTGSRVCRPILTHRWIAGRPVNATSQDCTIRPLFFPLAFSELRGAAAVITALIRHSLTRVHFAF